MKVNCNAGSWVTNLVGDLRGNRPVWYHPYGIANILSFKRVREKYEVQYESNERTFVVTKPDGMMFKFVESPEGLHESRRRQSS